MCSKERTEEHPLLWQVDLAHLMWNLGRFLDFVVLGEGEEIIHEIVELTARGQREDYPAAQPGSF